MEYNLAFSTKKTQVCTVLKCCALCGKLFTTINLQNHMRIHMNKANLKLLGLYEILLGTHFDHWIPVLGTPKGCPAQEQFRLFYLDPPTEHSNEDTMEKLVVPDLSPEAVEPNEEIFIESII